MTTTFEERALVALKEIVTEPSPRRRHGRKIAAIGAATAALAAGVFAASIASAPSPAFAVKSNNDGTVTVTVHSWTDAAGLERELGKRGVPTVAAYVPAHKQCRPGWYKPIALERFHKVLKRADEGPDGVTFVIDKSVLRKGETLILEAAAPTQPYVGKDGNTYVDPGPGYSVASGPVGKCVLIDLQPGK
ncbi:hypothetical protein [Fodinicola acaciae]|uniref:hypothetical protein n=1 Tax=Fodinicola acaciae TaxID=2681555 RepID=UPI0013D16A50|nr:hypothetical protein [Fodinicola acaciae]